MFNNINSKRLKYILLTGIVLTSNIGCSRKVDNTETIYIKPIIETTTTEIPTSTFETNELPTTTTETSQPIEDNSTNLQLTDEEIELVKKLARIEQEIDKIIETDKQSLENAKNACIAVVDFIFFEGEINGVKFKELSDDAKQKVLEISDSIITKIEEKYPNYKEDFSEKTKLVLDEAKKIIKNDIENIKNFGEFVFNENTYNSLKEAKDDVVEFSSNAWDFIKDFSISGYESGKQYIKDWYNNFKQK